MTVIAGVQTENAVYIAGDSACVSDYDMFLRAEPKVFRHGVFILGTAGGGRIMDVAKYSLEFPSLEGYMDVFMRTIFVDTLRKAIQDSGSGHSEDGAERLDGNYLVGVGRNLYVILSDFSVHTPLQGYAAIGAGSAVAHGALYATQDVKDPIKRLGLCVRAAETFNASVRAPFYYVSTEGKAGIL